MAKLTDNEKKLITSLANMPDAARDRFIQKHTKVTEILNHIFDDEEKVSEIEQASDVQLKKAILSSYAAKAYDDMGKLGLTKKYYGRKDIHILTKARLDKVIDDNNHETNVGEKRIIDKDKPGDFRAYVFSDSKGKQPGLHTRLILSDINGEKIGNSVKVSNPEYMHCKSPMELKSLAIQAANKNLLEDTNYLGKMCGLDESEFLDDFKAIYGLSLPDYNNQDTYKYITESLATPLSASECTTIFNIPIRRLRSYSDSDIRADIKEKDNGKTLEDYKIKNGDNGLTLNYMLAYIRRMGKDKEKDFLDAKIDYFTKIQDNARANKRNEFNISFASVNSVYRKYLKYKNTK